MKTLIMMRSIYLTRIASKLDLHHPSRIFFEGDGVILTDEKNSHDN
jgi:hypothetical protein